MKAINLKCEYLINPIGIDIIKPRLFWNCEDGTQQTAYRIFAVDDNDMLLWDSGKVQSSKMTGIPFGKGTDSKTKVLWKVKLWDEQDNEGEWSDTASFETAFYNPAEWKAKWISGNYKVNKKERYPVDCFKKSFTADKKIKKARLYATACGLYEIRINSKKAGNFCLAPGITDYRKRVQYQTYDVTDILKQGENMVTAELADGWYRGSVGAWGLRNQYGTQTKLLAQLEITYTDGTSEMIVTDKSWKWSNDGPICFADNKDGEIVDASKVPSYSQNALEVSHSVVPVCSNNVPVVEKETFKAQMSTAPSGKKIIDFRQNFAGYISFIITAHKGQKITLRFGEMLDNNGELTQKNIQCSSKKKTTPLQKIEYTCKEGVNTYKTKFAIFGFQYAEVDTDIEITADNFTAYAVYSDLDETGFFESSNELLNKFVEATKWSTKSNSTDLPTDCPTRERHGWTGDAQIFFESAQYLFNYETFSKKYLNDMYDWQKKDGRLPQIAPYGGTDFYMWVMNGSVGWSDAGVLIPYRFYKMTGDKRILSDYYDRMKKYAEFMIQRIGKKGGLYAIYTKPVPVDYKTRKYIVNYGQSYGEWAEPEDVHANHWTDVVTPHPEVSTAYTIYIMETMVDIAELLGKESDVLYFKSYAENCRKAYQTLVNTDKFSLDTDRQACLVRPLYMNLLDKKQTEFAKERLIKALEHYGWRLGTGFLSTPLILYVLEDIDSEYAYKLLENEKIPGWLAMPKNGATTIWESWEGKSGQSGIASLNHYSKGAVCEWLFKSMCGIRVDGENHFTISPKPGGHFDFAKAEYDSVYGKVVSCWKKQADKYSYEIEIPANCTAEIILPNGTKQTVTAGKYLF